MLSLATPLPDQENCAQPEGKSLRLGAIAIGKAAALWLVCSGAILGGAVAATAGEVFVDGTTQHQVLYGFGATTNTLVYEGIGDTLGPELRRRAIEAVYGRVRLNTGMLEAGLLESTGGWDQRGNDDDDPLHIEGRGFQARRAEDMQKFVLAQAEPLGFTDYILKQDINLRYDSPWLVRLRQSSYPTYLDEVAEQVLASVSFWRRSTGRVPSYLMLLNEPLSGNAVLTGGKPSEIVDLVKRVGARLRDQGFGATKFVVPSEESEEGSLNLAGVILADPEARPYVGAIAYHSYPYGSVYASVPRILATSGAGRPDPSRIAVRTRLRDLGARYGLPVWLTEVSHGEVDPRSYEDFLGRAVHIHDELLYANAAAYYGMNNLWDATSHKLHFQNNDLYSEEGTVVLVDNARRTVTITGMGYAIGHYARWIGRGATRIEATSADPLVQVVAFRDDRRARLVLVAINNASRPTELNVNLRGLRLGGVMSGEQSTASAYWVPLKPTPVGATSLKASLPPKSVTTLAADLAPPTGEPRP